MAEYILSLPPLLVYLLAPVLVFAEDALFVGFVIPGETAAVLAGVVASRGRVQLWLITLLVVLAAVAGDAVGYQVGRHIGPRLFRLRVLERRQERVEQAQESLRRRGGAAVFLARFVAFFRAVMPALAGAARMPYRRFLVWNAAGGIVWGVAFVLLGFGAGNSYQRLQRTIGRDLLIAAIALIAAVVAWRRHSDARRSRAADQ